MIRVLHIQKGRDQEFANLLEESEKALATKNGKNGKKGNARTRKSEKQEDAELIAEEVQEAEDDTFVFTESPACKLFTSAPNVQHAYWSGLLQTSKEAPCETIRFKALTG